MRKVLLLISTVLLACTAMAAYTIKTITGFNTDVVANGIGAASASTTNDVDSVNYAFLSPDYQLTGASALPTSYLPATGLINSLNTSGLSFQLAGYGGNNNLRLSTSQTGTLTFGTSSSATVIYLLGFSGSGSSTATITVTFSDATTQVFTGVNFNDWYNNSGYAITNIGRVLRTTGATDLAGTTGPRLYEVPLALSSTNFSKNIVSVTVARTGGSALNSILNIMGISTSNSTFAGGAYTINSTLPTSGTNYTSFTDAVTALTSGAITGAVTFTVAPASGPYVEKITIPSIAGASSTNRVTFNCNGRTMQYTSTDANNRTAIILNGADFITIDSLNIDVSAGTYGWGVLLTNGADSNIIRKCTVNASLTSTTAGNHIGIIINGSATTTSTSGNNGNGNLIEKNIIKGGYFGLFLYGNSTAAAYNTNNTISNNTIQDFYYYAMYLYYQTGLVVSANDISRPTRSTVSTTNYAMYVVSTTNILIEKNKIHNLYDAVTGSTATTYGIYLSGAGISAAQPNRVENNLIYKIGTTSGSIYGIYSFSNYHNIYHNTIAIDEPASTAGLVYAFYVYGTGANVLNNIGTVNRGGTGAKYCMYIGSTAIGTVNNNVWLNTSTTGTNGIGYYSAAFTTFTAWQAANGAVFDQQGRNIDPLFTSPSTGDFKPSEASINDIGATGTGVLTDILGVTRTTNPDPGAVEFALPPCTGTPTAGAVSASATNVCNGATFTLSLTGNSVGSGLTFQWQSSPTLAGTYTNVGSAQTSPLLTTSQTTSAYYRCAVRCGTGTIVNSSSVLVTSPSLVSGTAYTINSTAATGGTNFNNFTDAINFVKCGISGPVTFTVTSGSGPYNEAFTIPQIFGASSTNKITIKGNGATLNYNTSDANARTAITFNGADNVILDSLNIDVSAGTYGWGIVLMNQADSNIIRKCTITTSAASTSTNYYGILMSASNISASVGITGNYNSIIDNTIVGGYYSVYLTGNSGSYNKGNVFARNGVKDFYFYGIYVVNQDSLTLSGNDISRENRIGTSLTTAYCIYLSSGTNLLVEKNKIHDLFNQLTTSTSAAYGIYNFAAGTSAVQPNRIENNLVYNINNGGGTIYGIYSASYNYCNFYHNTIVLDDAAATAGITYSMYAYGTGVNIKNNIIHIARGGTGTKYCLYIPSTVIGSINNNILYNTSTSGTTNSIAYFNTTGYATLATWQASNALAYDQQSVSVDPVYANPSSGDYTPTSSTANNIGSLVGVLTDIKNITRSTTSPDAGAYEFSTLTVGLNYGAEGLVSPSNSSSGCYSSSETVKVRIRNNRTTTHNYATNPVTVTVNVTGAITQNLTFVLNTGTLASDATQDVTFATPLNMSAPGTYTFGAYTTLAGDVNTGNDAMLPVDRIKNALDAGTVSASPTNYCGNGGTLPTLTTVGHTGYASLKWQESNTSGTGFTDIVSATTVPYTVTAAITQNKYYRLVATCGTTVVNSPQAAVTYTNPTITGTTPATRCGTGTVTLAATPSTGATINWYAGITGGSPLATGNTYTTPSLTTTTTYYATAGNGQSSVALGLQDRVGATGNTGYTDVGLAFDATAPFILQSVAIYPVGTGGSATITIDLKNSAGTTIQTYTGTVTTAALPGVKTVIPINFTVPAGTAHRLVMNGATGLTSLIREVTTGFTYPYTAPGIASITSAYTGGVSSAYYYYFYDWQIATGCESPRTSVTATINNSPTCTPTPVTLLSFKGDRVGAINKLEWQTATEINNAGFELQRSADGVNFSQLSYVSSKATNGNSNSQLTYSYDDVKPLLGNNYYRLKQIDRDGKGSYSPTVLLKGAKASVLTISNVYPNPTVQGLNMILSSPTAEQVRIVVSDVTGKIVLQQTKTVAAGDNNVQINVSGLSAGTYVVKAVCSTGCETAVHKFVKQ